MIKQLEIRNRGFVGRELEPLPSSLMDGMEPYTIDPEWQWIVEYDGEIVAQILACYAHGVPLILRITATKNAPKSWAVVALRQMLRDCRERGCVGFMTMLEDSKPQEVKLMRIVQKLGGYVRPFYGAIVAGSTDMRY